MGSGPNDRCVHENVSVSQLSDTLHIYMHTSDTPVAARLHAPDVCI